MTKVANINQPYDVYIGRPGVWGNPFVIGRDGKRQEVLKKYAEWIYADEQIELRRRARAELRGKTLGCFCFPEACHGDILKQVADNNEMI